MKKNVAVNTDDPQQPTVNLTITGKVKPFAIITPRYARLTGPAGQTIKVDVTITPKEQYPFKIVDVQAKHGNYIKYSLDENKGNRSKGWVLHLENVKADKGRYADTITIKTDSRLKPTIKIGVYGYITAPVAAPADKQPS